MPLLSVKTDQLRKQTFKMWDQIYNLRIPVEIDFSPDEKFRLDCSEITKKRRCYAENGTLCYGGFLLLPVLHTRTHALCPRREGGMSDTFRGKGSGQYWTPHCGPGPGGCGPTPPPPPGQEELAPSSSQLGSGSILDHRTDRLCSPRGAPF